MSAIVGSRPTSLGNVVTLSDDSAVHEQFEWAAGGKILSATHIPRRKAQLRALTGRPLELLAEHLATRQACVR